VVVVAVEVIALVMIQAVLVAVEQLYLDIRRQYEIFC
jgi:hypothetical protein